MLTQGRVNCIWLKHLKQPQKTQLLILHRLVLMNRWKKVRRRWKVRKKQVIRASLQIEWFRNTDRTSMLISDRSEQNTQFIITLTAFKYSYRSLKYQVFDKLKYIDQKQLVDNKHLWGSIETTYSNKNRWARPLVLTGQKPKISSTNWCICVLWNRIHFRLHARNAEIPGFHCIRNIVFSGLELLIRYLR